MVVDTFYIFAMLALINGREKKKKHTKRNFHPQIFQSLS